jgi:predicted tellurium resistance membrane protein TerC
MTFTIETFWQAAHHMLSSLIGRLPALIVAAVVFVLFHGLSVLANRVIRRAVPARRANLGTVFGRLTAGAYLA